MLHMNADSQSNKTCGGSQQEKDKFLNRDGYSPGNIFIEIILNLQSIMQLQVKMLDYLPREQTVTQTSIFAFENTCSLYCVLNVLTCLRITFTIIASILLMTLVTVIAIYFHYDGKRYSA